MKRLLPLLLLLSLALAQPVFIRAPAIASDGTGVLTQLEVEVREGRGRILVTTEPLIGVDTQNSEKLAVQIAQNLTGADLSDKDIIFTFFADVSLVDGPSAGAAMTIATIAALQDLDLNDDVVITGTIEPDGSIGTVGGVLKKAKAASDEGIALFIIPSGQRVVTEYVKRVSNPSPGIYIETEEPVTIDIPVLAERWGLQVIEAKTISDALPYMIGNSTIRSARLDPYPLPSVQGSPALQQMAQFEIQRANTAGIDTTQADGMSRQGYHYTAANQAFQQMLERPSTANLEDVRFTVKSQLEQVRAKLGDTNRSSYYSDDIEWLAAAQQRYVQAHGNADSQNLVDLYAAQEWLALAEFALSRTTGIGDRVDASQVQLKLATLINEASEKSMVSQAMGDSRPSQFLELAVKASESGYALGAMNLAADSIAIGESSTISPLLELDEYLDQTITGGWANAYRDHALYLRWQSAQGEAGLATEALYYAIRANRYSSLYTFVPAPAPQHSDETTGPQPLQDEFLLALLGAYLLSLYAVYEARKKRDRRAVKEKIEDLRGRIEAL